MVRNNGSKLLIIGILMVSFNLRPSITAVGPLIPLIREELQLSNGWAGFLTTLPLLTFATVSLFSAGIGNKIGNARAILVGLVILAVGSLIRVQAGTFLLFFGTGLTGIGIVICNVLLIPFIKTRMPHKIGLATALFSTGMTFFGAIGSGIAVPLALDWDLGWRGSLLSWIFLIVMAIVLWIPQIKKRKSVVEEKVPGPINIWKSKLAWQVSMFMGIQSLLFFTLITWLPDFLIHRGLSPVEAGVAISLIQVMGLIGTFFAPIIALKFKDQIGINIFLGLAYILGFSCLFVNALAINFFGLALAGLCMGSSISMAYTMIGLRTSHTNTTASLSGMAQSSGYYLAALGPVLFGITYDIFRDWNFLVYLMLIGSVLFLYFGIKAGRNIKI